VKPSFALEKNREAARAAVSRFRAINPGSRARPGRGGANMNVVSRRVLTVPLELVYRLHPIRDEIAAPGGPRESSPSDEI
jgi:hypothetical protein